MMQQYVEAKKLCGDALLLFRMGDFYELFYEDAKRAAEAVGLTLTSRDKSTNPIPMAGFPHHQLEGYMAKLIQGGYRVAICEQVEDPKLAKGLVRREVTRVVSPGTLTDDGLLDPRESNYLAGICRDSGRQKSDDPYVGLAWVELSTGQFLAARIRESRLADEMTRIAPSECIIAEGSDWADYNFPARTMRTRRPTWAFGRDGAYETIEKHFGTQTLEGFGFEDDDEVAVRAAGAVLEYLIETQKSSLAHIERVIPYRPGQTLEIDQSTRRSLELTRTLREGRREGSLLSVIDRTVTAMGARQLSDWLANPLTHVDAIEQRLDSVEELIGDEQRRTDLREALRGVYDLQRLLTRVTTGRASPRDLGFVSQTLERLPLLKSLLSSSKSVLLQTMHDALDLCPDVQQQLQIALKDELPLVAREGGIIRPGFNPQLDELRELAVGGKQWIAQYQATQLAESGIPSLKVGYNKVFGYYIEVTNAHRDKIPSHFIRKQTLKNAERYITPELKEYEEKVLTADDQAKELEYELFVALRTVVEEAAGRLRTAAAVLAQVDVLTALADLARRHDYCRPIVVDEPVLEIVEGRHPVLDIVEPQGSFVPNDTTCAPENATLLLITGPNMAGKSTYIRQVALITLMAQLGSFVPARAATIGVADRIYARVGASDELSRGQSTFMVEMTETARILNTATTRSLVILDEIGRGTSTYDGVSLAWAVVEHLHDHVGCRTLFATHYHELTDLETSLARVVNLNVAVREWDDRVVFLHKIIQGAANKSYGIHVAQLAGVPASVNSRAKQILAELEAHHHHDPPPKPTPRPEPARPVREFQLTLFGIEEHPILDEIRSFAIEETSPLDAFQAIKSWQEQLKSEIPQLKPR
jgi:DNA mismatch repair protein MutS